ncbi:MAG: YhcH/YjgK/YiaL family protein [Leptotrichiaceae bacterium]|nr:YhcH/YjgK/YiaL family protein [Leptotrichiaceae bacterium]
MIFTNLKDNLQNQSLSEEIKKCIEFTNKNKIEEYEAGVYEIPEINMKMNVGHYTTKSEKECFWESHLKYIDVQIILKGEEYIAFNNIRNLREIKRDKEKDLIEYEGNELFRVLLKEGDVLVLFPEDGHMPGMMVNEPVSAKKVVYKIKI